MRRVMIAALLSLVALAAALALVAGDLPDPVATHFGVDGTADGFSAPAAVWAMGLGLPAVLAFLLGALVGGTHDTLPSGLRWIRGLPVGIVWAVGGTMLATLVPQRGLDDASSAQVPVALVLGALALAAVVTVLAARLAPSEEPPASRLAAPAGLPRADVDPSSTALWQGTTPRSGLALALAGGLVVAGLVTAVVAAWWLGLLLGAISLVAVAATRFRVVIGPAAVRASGWLGGWPRVAVPMETVAAAEATTMGAFAYGGPGLRVAVGQPVTAVVTGTGPALDLVRTDGSRVRISLDDAADAVAVVNTLLDRRDMPDDPGRRATGTTSR